LDIVFSLNDANINRHVQIFALDTERKISVILLLFCLCRKCCNEVVVFEFHMS